MSTKQKQASDLMPTGTDALLILRKRANLLAKEELDTREKEGIAFIRFQLSSNETYGIPYHYVQCTLNHAIMAKPPFLPDFVAGVINWRGSLITIVNLKKFFHPDYLEPYSDDVYIIVVTAHNKTIGLLVNQIEGSAHYQPSQLSQPLSSVNVANPLYILGLHQAIIAILNTEELVTGLCKEINTSLYRTGDIHGSYN